MFHVKRRRESRESVSRETKQKKAERMFHVKRVCGGGSATAVFGGVVSVSRETKGVAVLLPLLFHVEHGGYMPNQHLILGILMQISTISAVSWWEQVALAPVLRKMASVFSIEV